MDVQIDETGGEIAALQVDDVVSGIGVVVADGLDSAINDGNRASRKQAIRENNRTVVEMGARHGKGGSDAASLRREERNKKRIAIPSA